MDRRPSFPNLALPNSLNGLFCLHLVQIFIHIRLTHPYAAVKEIRKIYRLLCENSISTLITHIVYQNSILVKNKKHDTLFQPIVWIFPFENKKAPVDFSTEALILSN
jgi:hypothetical protein